jgi:hypothetical protein
MLRYVPRLLVSALLLLLLATVFARPLQAQCDFISDYDTYDFSRQPLKREAIEGYTPDTLKYMRGILFGRHGRLFKDPEIDGYLKCRPWFKVNPDFQNSLLNQTERNNLDLIREMEAKKHEWIEPGDLRFYRDRLITEKMLGWHTGAEWRVLRAEVEAIYGKRFGEEPWLQKYFEERYWYVPDAGYDPKRLSDIERQNIETIAAAQKKQRNVSVSPGDMLIFQETPLTEELLRGLSLNELRLLRNEIFARRGRKFGSEWLQRYFEAQDWYEASRTGRGAELTAVEKKNAETIQRYENRLREELSTRPVTDELLEGLFQEDARRLRNEIYARRGKIFKDLELQRYFNSFDWYKPDPAFNEKSLNEIERANAAAIFNYEQSAMRMQDAVEG